MKIVVEYDEKETNSVKELIRVYNHKLGGKQEEEASKKDVAEIRMVGNNFRSVTIVDGGYYTKVKVGPELIEEMCGLMTKHADEIIGIGKAAIMLLKAVPGLKALLKDSNAIMEKNLGIKNVVVTERKKTA